MKKSNSLKVTLAAGAALFALLVVAAVSISLYSNRDNAAFAGERVSVEETEATVASEEPADVATSSTEEDGISSGSNRTSVGLSPEADHLLSGDADGEDTAVETGAEEPARTTETAETPVSVTAENTTTDTMDEAPVSESSSETAIAGDDGSKEEESEEPEIGFPIAAETAPVAASSVSRAEAIVEAAAKAATLLSDAYAEPVPSDFILPDTSSTQDDEDEEPAEESGETTEAVEEPETETEPESETNTEPATEEGQVSEPEKEEEPEIATEDVADSEDTSVSETGSDEEPSEEESKPDADADGSESSSEDGTGDLGPAITKQYWVLFDDVSGTYCTMVITTYSYPDGTTESSMELIPGSPFEGWE